MDIVVTIEIDAPPADVWSYIRRIDRHVEWMRDAVRIDFVSEQRSGVGTVFDTLTRIGPLSTTDRMTITDWVEGETIGVRHEGAVSGEGRFTLSAVEPRRTRLDWTESLRLPWYFGGPLGGPVARPVLRATWRANLQGLRGRLERPGGADAPPTPGRVVGGGRDTVLRELGPDRVVRMARDGRSLASERAVMRHAAAAGYPVPAVHDSDDPDVVVMDRIGGSSMLDDLARRPWRMRRHARTLARLHAELGRIPAPASMPQFGSGDGLLHLDLHPGNVLLGPDGPVVVDWANAARGDPALDVATTWVVMRIGTPPGNAVVRRWVQTFRERFTSEFVRAAGAPTADHVLQAAELRLLDRRMLESERDALFELARAARRGTVPGL